VRATDGVANVDCIHMLNISVAFIVVKFGLNYSALYCMVLHVERTSVLLLLQGDGEIVFSLAGGLRKDNLCKDTCIEKKNSMALVCEGTIPTERTPLVNEVSANFCG
jgi:hypothetical protein